MGIAALFMVYLFLLLGTLLVATSWTGIDTFGVGTIVVLGLAGLGGWLLWHQHVSEDAADKAVRVRPGARNRRTPR